jgi:hypothetical protein
LFVRPGPPIGPRFALAASREKIRHVIPDHPTDCVRQIPAGEQVCEPTATRTPIQIPTRLGRGVFRERPRFSLGREGLLPITVGASFADPLVGVRWASIGQPIIEGYKISETL